MNKVITFFCLFMLIGGCGKSKPQNSKLFVSTSKVQQKESIEAQVKSDFFTSSSLYQNFGRFIYIFIDIFDIKIKSNWPKVLFYGDGIKVIFDGILSSFTGQISIQDNQFKISKPVLVKNIHGDKKVTININGNLKNTLVQNYEIKLVSDQKEYLILKKSDSHKKFYLDHFIDFSFPEEEIAKDLKEIAYKMGLNIELNFDEKKAIITSNAQHNKDIDIKVQDQIWKANIKHLMLVFENNRLFIPKSEKVNIIIKNGDNFFKFDQNELNFRLDYKISTDKEYELNLLSQQFKFDIDFQHEVKNKTYKIKYGEILDSVELTTSYVLKNHLKNKYQELGEARFYLSRFFNFHVHDPKTLLQSNSLDLESFKDITQTYHIRSVINLNQEYELSKNVQSEQFKEYIKKERIQYLSLPLDSALIPSELQLMQILNHMEHLPKPILLISKNGILRSSYIAHQYYDQKENSKYPAMEIKNYKLLYHQDQNSPYVNYFKLLKD